MAGNSHRGDPRYLVKILRRSPGQSHLTHADDCRECRLVIVYARGRLGFHVAWLDS